MEHFKYFSTPKERWMSADPRLWALPPSVSARNQQLIAGNIARQLQYMQLRINIALNFQSHPRRRNNFRRSATPIFQNREGRPRWTRDGFFTSPTLRPVRLVNFSAPSLPSQEKTCYRHERAFIHIIILHYEGRQGGVRGRVRRQPRQPVHG